MGVVAVLLIGSVAYGAAPATAPTDKEAAADDHALIHVEKVSNPADIIFMYPVNRPIQIAYSLKNQAGQPLPLTATFTFVDRHAQVLSTQTQNIQAGIDGLTALTFTVDPKGLLFGQYSGHLVLKGGDAEILRHITYVGVISANDIPKAKPGEFLFGLDTSYSPTYQDPRLLRFTQLMGTDIIRGGIAARPPMLKTWDDQIKVAAPIYRQYNLKLAYHVYPPDTRVKDHVGYMDIALKHLEMVARDYQDLMPFFEVGNEPDIHFFQGPMSMYADGFLQFRAAIKRGNPAAIVLNGGWAFDLDRVDQFYKIVKPADVDMIAYHGHGTVEAEERAYRNIHAVAAQNGFADKLLTETESGITALSPPQEDIQARVCPEKLVFAQSMHEPFFHWFRLDFDHVGEYSCTWERTQPRPSVLSYRATVETLRGYKYQQTLQLPYADAEAYLFAQIDGPGRACIAWVNGHDRHQAYLRIAGAAVDAGGVVSSDIYGNHQPFSLLEGGIAALTISEEPMWLLWSAATPFPVAVEPALIQTPTVAELQVNAANPLVLQIRNPLDHAVAATFQVQAQSDAQLALTPAAASFQLQPQEVKRIDLSATVGQVHQTIHWPEKWTVFCHTASTIDLAKLTDIPATLPGDKTPVTATQEFLRNSKIDLFRLAGYQGTANKITPIPGKTPAIVMAYVDSDEERTVTMGAGADFYMEWFVNGRPVFDDLASGNGPGFTFLDHTFDIHLKKGRNLLVARVLSGSHGFTLAIGGPEELENASGASNRNCLQLQYTYNGTNTVTQSLGIDFLRPVEPLGDLTLDSPLDAWERFVPSIVLADRNLVNLHFKHPDSSMWFKGYSDLSAVAWLRADKDNLDLLIKVTDDIHCPAPDASKLNDFDSIAVAFSPTGKDDIANYRIGLVGDQPVIMKTRASGGLPAGLVPADNNEIRSSVIRDEATKTTLYRVALRRAFTTDGFYLNFLVNDNDTGVRKQYLEWKPGMETLDTPTNWYRIRFAPE